MTFQNKIANFRSQMLMGRYQKAIQLGEAIIKQMENIKKISNISIQTLYQNMKEQYQITKKLHFQITISKSQQRKKAVSKWEGKQKTNLNQIIKSKWQSPRFSSIKNQEKQIQKSQSIKTLQKQQDFTQKESIFTSEESIIEQQLHRQIILPLNMPELFKLKTRFPIINVPESHIENVVSYLKTYDFQLIKALPQLNLSHMLQLIKQLAKRSIIRGVMILEQNNKQQVIKILQQLKEIEKQSKITLISIIKLETKQQTQKFLTFS